MYATYKIFQEKIVLPDTNVHFSFYKTVDTGLVLSEV